MEKLVCVECKAIAEELRDAFVSAWQESDQQSRDAWLAIRKLMGGTEENMLRAEELLNELTKRSPD